MRVRIAILSPRGTDDAAMDSTAAVGDEDAAGIEVDDDTTSFGDGDDDDDDDDDDYDDDDDDDDDDDGSLVFVSFCECAKELR